MTPLPARLREKLEEVWLTGHDDLSDKLIACVEALEGYAQFYNCECKSTTGHNAKEALAALRDCLGEE